MEFINPVNFKELSNDELLQFDESEHQKLVQFLMESDPDSADRVEDTLDLIDKEFKRRGMIS